MNSILSPVPSVLERYPIRRVLERGDPLAEPTGLALPHLLERLITSERFLSGLEEGERLGKVDPCLLGIVGCGAALDGWDWAVADAEAELALALSLGGLEEGSVDPKSPDTIVSNPKLRLLPSGRSSSAHLPRAAGYGWAMRLREAKGAIVALFPAEAAVRPDFHDGLNFAAVYDAPVVFVGRRRRADDEPLAPRGVAYGLSAERVDGGDPLAVFEATKEALAHVRGGKGPALLDLEAPQISLRAAREKLTNFALERGAWPDDRNAKIEDSQAEKH